MILKKKKLMKSKNIAMILTLMLASIAFAEGKPQTTCPVMGGKIDKEQYIDVKGYRIYVCCKGCIDVIKADPKKVIKKMKAEGIELEKIPKPDAKTGATKKWFKRTPK